VSYDRPRDPTERSPAEFYASQPAPLEFGVDRPYVTPDTGPTPTIDLVTGEPVTSAMSSGASTGGMAGGVGAAQTSGDASFPPDMVDQTRAPRAEADTRREWGGEGHADPPPGDGPAGVRG